VRKGTARWRRPGAALVGIQEELMKTGDCFLDSLNQVVQVFFNVKVGYYWVADCGPYILKQSQLPNFRELRPFIMEVS
jgi:hypothetical protein